jgi:hypothetical protein
MNVKEAVSVAKDYVADLFIEEKIVDLGLEEVEYDDSQHVWNVTLGFSRPWNNRNPLVTFSNSGLPKRDYKVVKVSDTSSQVISIKQHKAD